MSYIFTPTFREYDMLNLAYLFGKFHLQILDTEYEFLHDDLKEFFTKVEDKQQQSQGQTAPELAQGSASNSVPEPISD